MSLKNARDEKLLYHLTKLDNLDSICKKGLLSRKSLEDENGDFSNIADSAIIAKRRERGILDLIPFHFHAYSAFDYTVMNKYPNDNFIYLCLHRDYARKNNFKILPRHPLSTVSIELYDYSSGFNEIDWDAMAIENNDDEYVKSVKMAECLAPSPIGIDTISKIGVPNEEIESKVNSILEYNNIENRPYVNINKEWFDKRGKI